jgi:hypothetical protein
MNKTHEITPIYKNKNENQTQKHTQDSVQSPDTLSQLDSRASLLSKRIRQSRSHNAWRTGLSSLTAPASELSKANKLSQFESDLRTGGPHTVGLPPPAINRQPRNHQLPRQLFGFHFRCLFET